jgi:hypothetical protein
MTELNQIRVLLRREPEAPRGAPPPRIGSGPDRYERGAAGLNVPAPPHPGHFGGSGAGGLGGTTGPGGNVVKIRPPLIWDTEHVFLEAFRSIIAVG